MSVRLIRRTLAKTAAYTIKAPMDSPGTVFTNRGAGGSVTFTLPAPSAAVKGYWYRFIVIAAQALIVATATADTLIGYNDLDLDSIETNTVGAQVELFCDGTSWIAAAIEKHVTYTLND